MQQKMSATVQRKLHAIAALVEKCTFLQLEQAMKKYKVSYADLVAFRDIKNGDNILHFLAKNLMDPSILEYFLVTLKMPPDTVEKKEDGTIRPLRLAIGCRNMKAVKLLVENGAEVYYPKNDGRYFDAIFSLKVHARHELTPDLIKLIERAKQGEFSRIVSSQPPSKEIDDDDHAAGDRVPLLHHRKHIP